MWLKSCYCFNFEPIPTWNKLTFFSFRNLQFLNTVAKKLPSYLFGATVSSKPNVSLVNFAESTQSYTGHRALSVFSHGPEIPQSPIRATTELLISKIEWYPRWRPEDHHRLVHMQLWRPWWGLLSSLQPRGHSSDQEAYGDSWSPSLVLSPKCGILCQVRNRKRDERFSLRWKHDIFQWYLWLNPCNCFTAEITRNRRFK